MKPFSVTNSPFHDLALFLAERYQLEGTDYEPPSLEIMIDGTLPIELREEGRKVYLIGTVLESILVSGKEQAKKILQIASEHLAFSEGVLAWDSKKNCYIFWVEVTNYTGEAEFTEHLERFLSQLVSWMKLIPTST